MQARAAVGVVLGNRPEPQTILICFLSIVPGSKQACVHSSGAESQVLTALWYVPLIFKPASGIHLSIVGPQDWGS